MNLTRRHVQCWKSFHGSLLNQDAQTSSVPPQLPSFIRRLLGGASKYDGNGNVTQSICSLTKLFYSNSVKRHRKESEGIPINNDIVNLVPQLMSGFLFIMQRDLQILFILCSSLVYLYQIIGFKKSERNFEIRFASSFWKVELYGDIHCLKVLEEGTASTKQPKFHCPIQHQVVLALTEKWFL